MDSFFYQFANNEIWLYINYTARRLIPTKKPGETKCSLFEENNKKLKKCRARLVSSFPIGNLNNSFIHILKISRLARSIMFFFWIYLELASLEWKRIFFLIEHVVFLGMIKRLELVKGKKINMNFQLKLADRRKIGQAIVQNVCSRLRKFSFHPPFAGIRSIWADFVLLTLTPPRQQWKRRVHNKSRLWDSDRWQKRTKKTYLHGINRLDFLVCSLLTRFQIA